MFPQGIRPENLKGSSASFDFAIQLHGGQITMAVLGRSIFVNGQKGRRILNRYCGTVGSWLAFLAGTKHPRVSNLQVRPTRRNSDLGSKFRLLSPYFSRLWQT